MTGAVITAAEAATQELTQRQALVSAALKARLGAGREYYWPDIRAMYPERAVVMQDGRYYSYAYTIGEDNQVSLAEPLEVIPEFQPVTAAESIDTFEAVAGSEGTQWDVVIVREGVSKNGNQWTAAALEGGVPLFEGARVFARSDAEHQADVPDVTKLVGWVSAPRYTTGKVVGRLNLSRAAATLRETLVDAWQRGKRDLMGLSVVAEVAGVRAPSKGVRIRVDSIAKVKSVDLIVNPSAGGELVQLVESEEPAVSATATTQPTAEQQAAAAAAAAAQQQAAIAEAVNRAVTDALAGVNTRMRALEKVATAQLPAATRDRLRGELTARATLTEADVDAAIVAERDYLTRITDGGKVQLPDFGDGARVTESHADKALKMLEELFKRDDKGRFVGSVQSIKECYVALTGDTRVTGHVAECDRRLLREATGAVHGEVAEAIDTTVWANALGNTLYRVMIEEYRRDDQYGIWRLCANTVPLSDFRSVERVRYGGYGDLPTVTQGAAYLPLTTPSDEKASYSPAKRGGIETVTVETVRNDDVGAVREIPVKMARASQRTLAKFVLDFMRTNPTIYDGVALYHANHANLGSAALDATSFAARRLAMIKQTELSSADRIGVGPKYLWVPYDLQETAVNLFRRTTENDPKFVVDIAPMVVPVWYWTDANDWVISADTRDVPFIEIGFLDGREEPELFVQDAPNVGSLFSNDQITYKIRHIWGGAVKDYRGTDKSVVA